MTTANMIEMKEVSKRFGSKIVLDGVNLHLEKRKSLAVIGGSGSGKSVTLKCILGLLKPEQGSILINGEESCDINKKKRDALNSNIGMLFQNGALFDSMTVWQNVAFDALNNRKLSHEEARLIAKETLALVGLKEHVMDVDIASLSGGMHKRIGLARAIAPKPDILFFDEPTTGLDPIMSDLINHLIRDCVKELGATALTITHDMTSVNVFADEVAMLYQGKIIWQGRQEDIANTDRKEIANFIHGEVEE
ncbi:MAG: ABC transporter ATP-binding protein [Parvibaculales bacterium]